jgi:NhaA family Na+:H+ antiporter
LKGASLENVVTPNTVGIFLGLLVGKPLGIVAFSLLAIKLGFSNMPAGMSVRRLSGAGFLGGIGFTMAIFVTFLAFGESPVSESSKLAVLLGSLLAGAAGYVILRGSRQGRQKDSDPDPNGEESLS